MPGPRVGAAASRPLTGLTIAHLGHFDPEYSRNRTMAKAMRRAGADVVTISDTRQYLSRTPALLRRAVAAQPDVVVVAFPGHADVLAARMVGVRRDVPVIFDPLVSLYETAVEDRKRVAPGGLGARRYLVEDRMAAAVADVVVVDTDAHLAYYRDFLRVSDTRLARLWVGSDDEMMYPRPRSDDHHFRVFFYGTFVPLQGVEHILRASQLIERAGHDVRITLAGTGQTYASARRLSESFGLRSVDFRGRVPYADLPRLMADSDICLGIFGTSGKAGRVIPNKVFDALAMARAVVTADTPAAREVLVNGEHAVLCPAGRPDALADAILTLKADGRKRQRIAEQGHLLFRTRFSLAALADDVAAVVLRALDARAYSGRGPAGLCPPGH